MWRIGERRTIVRQLRHVLARRIVERQLSVCASSSTAAAVNCFDTEPASKIVSGVLGGGSPPP